MYGRRGLGLAAIGEIVVFSGISVALGLGFIGGLSLLWHGERLGHALDISSFGVSACPCGAATAGVGTAASAGVPSSACIALLRFM